MAKKVTGYIKLQIPAGKATPAPPVGPALGQHGVNIVEFTKQFNARTADKGDLIIPVVITVYADRSFSFITKTPPAAVLLKKACNILFLAQKRLMSVLSESLLFICLHVKKYTIFAINALKDFFFCIRLLHIKNGQIKFFPAYLAPVHPTRMLK